jgi:hypothetical protein
MNPAETIVAIAAVLAAVTVIAHFVRKIYVIARRIEQSLGMDAKGRTVTDRLERIEHQLFPNGGTSLVDKMNRIEVDQHKMQGRMESMERTLGSILRHLDKEDL